VRKTISKGVFLILLILATVPASAQSRSDYKIAPVTSSVSCVPGSKAKADPAEARREAKRFYKAGVNYGLAKSFQQAATSFLLATCLQPDFADAYHGLGHAYFDLKRWQDSIKALERAVELNPKDRESYEMMGHAYLNLRRESKSSSPMSGSTVVGERVSHNASSVSPSNSESSQPVERALTAIYRIGAGDVLDVRFHKASIDQQNLYTVSSSGLLDHPMLSQPLKVSGLTAEEIGSRIESDLKSRALGEQSQVSVGVREYNSHTIIVSGLLKEPGTKVLRREAIPLYVVIADAQPLPEATRAVITSHQKNDAVVVDLSDSKANEFLIFPGDVISVERAPQQFFYIGGDVKVPGEKLFRPGLTLTQAILSAGGFSRKANEAEVAREKAKAWLEVKQYNLKDIYASKVADPEILPGDRINVSQ
jgi:protein involved in polysaccharide export with SLBB domain